MTLPTLDIHGCRIWVDADHRYWRDGPQDEAGLRNRSEVPGVTALLKKAGMISTEWITQYALDRGTAVHDAILYEHQGDLDESSLDPAVAPYLKQWREFTRLTKPEIMGAEQIVFSKLHQYAGRYDLLLRIFGDSMLVDIKTNHAPPWVSAQLGFYSFALREMGTKVSRVGCLELKPGAYSLKTWEPLQAEAEAFRVLATLKALEAK